MAYVPFATEFSAVYNIVAPSGATATLNNPLSANYAGMVKEITGLDSAEVRESASELVEADGGQHGAFYFGRRPITMTVSVFGHETALERATKIDRLHRATQGLRADCTLQWTPTYAPGTSMYVPFRLQQPIRDTGPWSKEVMLSLVSQYAVILGSTLNTSASIASGGAGVVLENQGSAPSYPLIRITGPSTAPQVSDGHGGVLKMGPSAYPLILASGETIQVDCVSHNATFIAGARNGQNGGRYIDYANTTTWPNLITGNNTFTLTGGGTAVVVWRSTWH